MSLSLETTQMYTPFFKYKKIEFDLIDFCYKAKILFLIFKYRTMTRVWIRTIQCAKDDFKPQIVVNQESDSD